MELTGQPSECQSTYRPVEEKPAFKRKDMAELGATMTIKEFRVERTKVLLPFKGTVVGVTELKEQRYYVTPKICVISLGKGLYHCHHMISVPKSILVGGLCTFFCCLSPSIFKLML